MTRIKICGLTDLSDVFAAEGYGADAVGFIGVPESPRYVTPEQFAHLTRHIGIFVHRVIVVKRPEDAALYNADYIQYYDESEDLEPPVKPHIRCFRVAGPEAIEEIQGYSGAASALLLDTFHREQLGGGGSAFDWSIARKAQRDLCRRVILAGGLTPDNVKDALDAVHPFGVDVASGVEIVPGIKDHNKIRAFIKAVREWASRTASNIIPSNVARSNAQFRTSLYHDDKWV